MILDSSAFLAILQDEPEKDVFLELVAGAASVKLSAASYVEIILRTDRNPASELGTRADQLIEILAIDIVDFTAEQAFAAREANRRFGKGRHPAGLNFGDCLTYALAKVSGEPLLYKGEDFARTDIPSAL